MRYRKTPNKVFTVREATTLLPFLMKTFDGISRNKAKAILADSVWVDRQVVTQFDHPLRPGQVVEVSATPRRATLRNRFVRLVYEDAHIVVIDKAPGILSMAAGRHSYCVKTVLDDYFQRRHQRCTAHVVHRLDRDTSGLMVYAKTMAAEQTLEHNWHDIVADRRYVALVSGQLQPPEGQVESWLKDTKSYVTYSSPVDNGGKYACTRYRTLRQGALYSLVELKLLTGRKNQIRVHMQSLGHPVCGDVKYGDGADPIHRLALHAFRLHFYHPVTGELMKFETPVPQAFTDAVKAKAVPTPADTPFRPTDRGKEGR